MCAGAPKYVKGTKKKYKITEKKTNFEKKIIGQKKLKFSV